MADEKKATDTDAASGNPGTGDAPGQESGDEQVTFTDEQQAKIDRIIAERLSRAESKWQEKTERERQKAKEEAERKRLEEQAEWEKLAKQHQTELEEIKPAYESASEKLERYQSALSGYLEAARDGVPQYVTDLLDRLDPVEQLTWLTEHADEMAKPKAPSLNAGEGGDKDMPKRLTDEQKAQFEDILGIPAEYLPEDLDELMEE
jgi:molecular chaperone GrpE (heat shock protein)